jgi:transposase
MRVRLALMLVALGLVLVGVFVGEGAGARFGSSRAAVWGSLQVLSPASQYAFDPQLAVAVQLVLAGRSVRDVAESLGCSDQSLHNCVKQHQLDRRERDDGLTSAERDELRELRKRVKRVERERDILKRAAVLFAAETETRRAPTGSSRRRGPVSQSL